MGHHTANRLAVSVFHREATWEEDAEQAEKDASDLNAVIALYGLCGYLNHIGQTEKRAVETWLLLALHLLSSRMEQ